VRLLETDADPSLLRAVSAPGCSHASAETPLATDAGDSERSKQPALPRRMTHGDRRKRLQELERERAEAELTRARAACPPVKPIRR